jgi:hypothetical protein
MDDSGKESRLIRDLEEKIQRNEDRIKELTRALYGYPELGQRGFREEMERQLELIRVDVSTAKQMCEDLRQERRDELSERRGLRKAVGYTGITNFVTLLMLIGLILSLWQGIFGS